MINNMQIINKSQHPHLYQLTPPDIKQNRSKIQITYAQNYDQSSLKTQSNINFQTNISRINHIEPLSIIQKQQRSSHSLEINKNQPSNTQLFLLMKEQIDIACTNYREKMNHCIKLQAQEIQKLSFIVGNNNQIIQKQSEIIKQLRRNQDHLTQTKLERTDYRDISRGASKSPSKLSLTQKKSISKPRSFSPLNNFQGDIEARLQLVMNKLQDLDKKLKQEMIYGKEIQFRLNKFENKFGTKIWNNMSQCKDKLNTFLTNFQKKLNTFDFTIERQSKRIEQNQHRMQFLNEQIDQIRQLISNISQRQYNYDSFQLQVLKDELMKIANKVKGLQENNCPKQKRQTSINSFNQFYVKNSSSPQSNHQLNYSQHLPSKSRNMENNYNNELNRSQLSSLSHYAPKYKNQQDRVRKSNDWQMDQDGDSSFSEEDDQFFYPQVQSQLQIINNKVQRLQRILLRQNNNRLPVHVEVDQTGYIKYCSTGMYILDENGDGFDLNGHEFEQLQVKGVIIS